MARREDKLEELRDEIAAANPGMTVTVRAHDVTDTAAAAEVFEDLAVELDGVDMVTHNAGVMPEVGEDEYSIEKDRLIMEVNVIGAMAWLNLAAERFAAQGSGVIVGISSVAGDRGRRGFPAYCTSKAALTTYLEALRNRLSTRGVDVVTIKPGPVATPMTEGRGKMPLMIPVEQAANEIFTAIRARNTQRYVPLAWAPIMTALRHVPSRIFRHLNI